MQTYYQLGVHPVWCREGPLLKLRRLWLGIKKWNYSPDPARWWVVVLWGIPTGLWVVSLFWVCWEDKLPPPSGPLWLAVVAGFLWATHLGGGLVSFWFAEFNRSLFGSRALLGYQITEDGQLPAWRSGTRPLQVPAQPRYGPRIEPFVLGFIERTLFFLLAVVTLIFIKENGPVVISAAAGGYVAIKAFKRPQAQTSTTPLRAASIHSIWGSSVSVGFGVFGGWVFKSILVG